MRPPKVKARLFWALEALLLAGTIASALLIARPQEWQPAELLALLLALALLGHSLSIDTPSGQLSASLVAIVLAMGLLGPGPAAACGVAAMVFASSTRRRAPSEWLNNLSIFAVVPFLGGLLVRVLTNALHVHADHRLTHGAVLGLVLFGVFVLTVALNFAIDSFDTHLRSGRPFERELADLFALLPGELAAGGLATVLAVSYTSVGMPMLLAASVVLLIFRQLTVALLRSEERAERLLERSRQLVGLQLGVLRTLVRALAMRDESTARHAAAVARYARTLALEVGCTPDECELVHTAGLLHEIGRFTWPDRVLHADVVAPEDLALVQSHPQEGAILVGALDGYGPVADAILHHHERIDGRGYPAGLIGSEIPLASRILAICSTYDTMIAPGGYITPMEPVDAIEELRHSAKQGQFDSELVEAFAQVLQREGQRFAQNTEFEAELEFERRVRSLAEPRAAARA